jgi:ABC-type transport system involved in multi-copper enzyme maturation permease subunit
MRSEWTKLTSVRSTRWTFLALIVGTIAVGVAASAATGANWAHQSASDRASFDPTNVSLSGLAFGELAIGVLGVLVITGEYTSGAIRSTLSAVPRRSVVVMAKAIVFGTAALAVGEILTFATFLASQAALGPAPHASLTHATVLRALIQSGAFLALIGLLGLGVGTVIRHSAGAIGALVGVVLVAPLLVQALPDHVGRFMPEEILSSSVADTVPAAHQLTPWVGVAVMTAYVVVILALGAVTLARRDA